MVGAIPLSASFSLSAATLGAPRLTLRPRFCRPLVPGLDTTASVVAPPVASKVSRLVDRTHSSVPPKREAGRRHGDCPPRANRGKPASVVLPDVLRGVKHFVLHYLTIVSVAIQSAALAV